MSYSIRIASTADQSVLEEMLYLALWQPPGTPPPPRSVLQAPELSRYVSGWGTRPGDFGLIAAAVSAPVVGAAWLRVHAPPGGYGFWRPDTPELSVAVLPGHRNQGIGSALLRALLSAANAMFPAVSLSVALANPAFRLYQRLGFGVVHDDGHSAIMVLPLHPSTPGDA